MSRITVLQGSPGVVFSNVLAVDTATLDTGANAIPAGANILDIYAICRTDEATVASNIGVTFNGDGGGNYDSSRILNTNSAVTGTSAVAAAAIPLQGAGASLAANIATSMRITVPGYAGTTFFKAATVHLGVSDATAANARVAVYGADWRSTAAINQVTLSITSGSGQKFKAGSALYVYLR